MEFNISSEAIGQITEALSKAQGCIENALKDSANPFFKSKYADLSSVMAVTKEPLSSNNLCFSSSIVQSAGANFLICTLSHISGEWFRSYMPLMMAKQDMQSLGAAISYGRRFCLAALCHVGVEETDGEGCIDRMTAPPVAESKTIKLPPLTQLQRDKIIGLVEAIDDEKWLENLKIKALVTEFINVSPENYGRLITSLEKKVSE